MECCVNALVTSFKETVLAECPGMIKRNETESEYHETHLQKIDQTRSSVCPQNIYVTVVINDFSLKNGEVYKITK